MIDMKGYVKAFEIPSESWCYSERYENSILIGIYDENGEGTRGEFLIEWGSFGGVSLRAFSDSWEALANMPELIELLSKISQEGKEPDMKEFAEMLKGIGYKDITQRGEIVFKMQTKKK